MADYKFFGWLGKDKNAVGNLVWEEFTPRHFTENDIDVKVSHCGICASDLHVLRSGWGPSDYPVCPGHEIVGHVARVGKNVTNLKVGDRVAVGAVGDSCHHCNFCNDKQESYCSKMVQTYGSKLPDGSKTYGGYANYHRVNSVFAFKIPDSLPSEIVAPMMCAGVTVYAPLKQHGVGKTAKKVGIVGIGGLGHFGILFAKALGAEVYAISSSDSKKEDALKLGASHFINTKEDINAAFQPYSRQLDLVLVTANDAKMPVEAYAGLLKPRGTLHLVGAPEAPISIHLVALIMAGINISTSLVGGTVDIKDMLQVAATQKVHSWVQTKPMKEVNQTLHDMEAGKARYRFVLVQDN